MGIFTLYILGGTEYTGDIDIV